MVWNSKTMIEPLYLPGPAKELKTEDPAAGRQEEFQMRKCRRREDLEADLDRNNKREEGNIGIYVVDP